MLGSLIIQILKFTVTFKTSNHVVFLYYKHENLKNGDVYSFHAILREQQAKLIQKSMENVIIQKWLCLYFDLK